MTEIDDILSASLKRVAQPGDATGVADAIRSRVDAGDTGTPAGSSGFGGESHWWPWLAIFVAAGLLVGGGAGASAWLATPTALVQLESEAIAPTLTPTVVRSATPTPTPTLSAPPSFTPPPLPAPEPPAPIADDSPPVIQQFASTQTTVYIANQSSTTLIAVVTDDVGVASVALSWSGATSGAAAMQLTAGAWQYVFTPPQTTTPATKIIFVGQAFDAAGNASGLASVLVETVY